MARLFLLKLPNMFIVNLPISFLKCRLFSGRDSVVYLCLTQPHNTIQIQLTTGDKGIYSLRQIAGQEESKIPTTSIAFHPRVHSTDICFQVLVVDRHNFGSTLVPGLEELTME